MNYLVCNTVVGGGSSMTQCTESRRKRLLHNACYNEWKVLENAAEIPGPVDLTF